MEAWCVGFEAYCVHAEGALVGIKVIECISRSVHLVCVCVCVCVHACVRASERVCVRERERD